MTSTGDGVGNFFNRNVWQQPSLERRFREEFIAAFIFSFTLKIDALKFYLKKFQCGKILSNLSRKEQSLKK